MRRASLAALTLAAAAGIPPAPRFRRPRPGHDQAPWPAGRGLQRPAPVAEAGGVLTTTISQSAVADTNYNLDDPSPGTPTTATPASGSTTCADPDQSLGFGLDTGLRALGEAEEDFEFVARLAEHGLLRLPTARAPNTDFDAGARLRSRRVDYSAPIDIDGRAARRPDRLPGGPDRVPLRRRHRLHRSAPTRRAPTNSACSATNFDYNEDTGPRTTWCRGARSRARHLDAADHPGLLHRRRSAATTITPPTTTPTTRSTSPRATLGLVYEPYRDAAGPRRPRLCRPQPRPDHRRRPRDHPARHRPDRPRRLPLRPAGLHPARRRALDLRRPRPTGSAARSARVYTLPRGRVTGRIFQRYGGGQGGDGSAGHRRRHRPHPRPQRRLAPRLRRLLRHPGQRGRRGRARHRPHRPDGELRLQPHRARSAPRSATATATGSRTPRTPTATVFLVIGKTFETGL